MRIPRHSLTKAFIVVAITLALYTVAALIIGWDEIGSRLLSVSPITLLLVGLLSTTNYILRFLRWEHFLHRLDTKIPLPLSLSVYFSAYVMVITPGKIGEVFKASILKDHEDVNYAVGLPTILAERIYDFLAVLTLAIGGIFFWPGPLSRLTTGLVAAAALPALLLLLRHNGLRRALLGKITRSPLLAKRGIAIEEALGNLGKLLQPLPATGFLTLSTVAWLCEGLGMALICHDLGLPVNPGEAIFIYAAATIVGSLSFLPGGLGGTEAIIIWLLGVLGVAGALAATVALLIRAFTLWFAVVLGFIVLLTARKLIFQANRQEDG